MAVATPERLALKSLKEKRIDLFKKQNGVMRAAFFCSLTYLGLGVLSRKPEQGALAALLPVSLAESVRIFLQSELFFVERKIWRIGQLF